MKIFIFLVTGVLLFMGGAGVSYYIQNQNYCILRRLNDMKMQLARIEKQNAEKKQIDFDDAAAGDLAAQKAVLRIDRYLDETVVPIPGPTPQGFYARSLIPGLAQSYYGHEPKGTILTTLFGIGLATSGMTYGYTVSLTHMLYHPDLSTTVT